MVYYFVIRHFFQLFTVLFLTSYGYYSFSQQISGIKAINPKRIEGCNNGKRKEFSLTGMLSGAKHNSKFFLVRASTNDTIAECSLNHGKFKFFGSVPNGTEYYFLQLDSSIKHHQNSEAFLLTKGELILKGRLDEWPKIHLIGSQPQIELKRIENIWQTQKKEEDSIDSLIKIQNIHLNTALLTKQFNDTIQIIENINNLLNSKQKSISKRDQHIHDFILNHQSSLYVADLIRRIPIPDSVKENYYTSLREEAKTSYFGQKLNDYLKRYRLVKIIKEGNKIFSFDAFSADGKDKSIYDIIQNADLTLIDFWASWCKPCREAFPLIRNVFDKFKSKGFSVVSISLDNSKKDWEAAVRKENPNWLQLIDSINITQRLFDLSAIPGYILVDKSGKLLSFDCPGSSAGRFGPSLRSKDLEITISKLLNNSNPPFTDTKNITRPTTTKSAGLSNKPDEIRPILAGNPIPDVLFENIKGYTHNKLRLSELKGKLVILDFWSVYCAACIQQFPKLEKMQEKYKDNLVILAVGFDGWQEGSIQSFLNKRKNLGRELRLPCAIIPSDNKLLEKLFPFSSLPLEVWIDKNGNLINKTDHLAVTEENIEAILEGKQIALVGKKNLDIFISSTENYLLNTKSKFSTFGSAFTGYIDTLGCITSTKIIEKPADSVLTFVAANQTMFDYFKQAYQYYFPQLGKEYWTYIDKRVQYFPSPKGKQLRDWMNNLNDKETQEFRINNLFSYQLRLPFSHGLSKAYNYMISELEHFFNVQSKIEEIPIKIFKLISNDSAKSIRTALTSKDMPSIRNDEGDKLVFKGIQVSELLTYLNSKSYYNLPFIVTDNTQINFPVDLELPINLDLINLRKELNKIGLDLQEHVELSKVITLTGT